mgnify:CR=1 FL=1
MSEQVSESESEELTDNKLREIFANFEVPKYKALYNEIYEETPESSNRGDRIAASIYMSHKIVNQPLIVEEIAEIVPTASTDQTWQVVQDTQDKLGYEFEKEPWNYVFADLNNTNISGISENNSSQLREYYNETPELREELDEYEGDVAGATLRYIYRNMTPERITTDLITFDNTARISNSVNKYDVMDCYYNVFAGSEHVSLNANTIDPTGILSEVERILEEQDIEGIEERQATLITYDYTSEIISDFEIQHEVRMREEEDTDMRDLNRSEANDYDNTTVACILVCSVTNLTKDACVQAGYTNSGKFDRIKQKIEF